MKERPILFSGAMVAAILAGRKTKTRRVCRDTVLGSAGKGYALQRTRRGQVMTSPFLLTLNEFHHLDAWCPHGRIGDRLWVKETWRTDPSLDAKAPSEFNAWPVRYEADGAILRRGSFFGQPTGKTRVSIHMPRWASRLTLEITGICFERLQDISAEDAKAEGLACVTKDRSLYKYGIPDLDGLPGNDNHGWHWQEWERDPRNAYHKLWEQINGPGSAVANPWVWVFEFKRVMP